MLLSADLAVEGRVADRAVDPVVKTVAQIARAGVRVPRAEASKEHLAHVRFVVAVAPHPTHPTHARAFAARFFFVARTIAAGQ